MRFKKFISGLTSLALSLSAFAGAGLTRFADNTAANAAATDWKFDFGGGGTASGYTGVSAADTYDSGKGYGFTGSVSNVSASGSGALSDAVRFTGGTFSVDLPKGLYQVTVTTGDSPRTTINIEGMPQMMNLTGNNAVESIQIPVTDGKLEVAAVAGMNNAQYTISALEITQINTTGEMKPTVWICGDSTVANYYNTADTSQHGWGQYLKDYINTNVFEVRNQATSGQYAKGFVDAGQFKPIEAYGKAGDYYIISIGINDTNYSNADEYYTTVTSMVKTAKSKGMNVILVKQQGRHGDLNRNPKLGGRWFGGQLDTIASEQNVQVIDLFTAWQDFGISIGGYDAMTEYYAANDDLHQSAKGAQKNAELAQSLMKIGDTEMDTSKIYTFKNTNSGLVMDIVNGKMEEGSNVQQWGSNGLSCQQWTLTPFMNGTTYYYVRSVADPNYVLKAMSNAQGGNIEIVPYSGSDSMMLFQFTKIGDGSYYISTRASRDACFVEVSGASMESGANVQQWGNTYNKCQNWQAVTVTTTATTTTTTTTTTTSAAPVTSTTSAVPAERVIIKYPGDANDDNTVDVADAVMILQCISNKDVYGVDGSNIEFRITEQGMINADVTGNNDGVTALDAQFVQMYCAKLVELPPIEYGDIPETTTTATDPYAGYYFAVDQTWESGVAENTNSGFTKTEASMGKSDNTGYVNLENAVGSNITFTVNAEKSGNYMTHIRFANGSAADRKMKVFVNGDTNTFWLQSFTGTGAWTAWNEFGLVLPLKEGLNTIKFESAVAEGGPNLDYITITLTDEPIGETYDPNKYEQEVDASKPALYLAGDSTCMYYSASKQNANGGPIQGWGYYLADYFTEDVNIYNHAIAGRSSKKFYDEGRFTTIANSLKKGDYVMIQFAINDAGASNADRYAPVCGNVDAPTAGSYEWYMTEFIKATLEKEATPILMSCTLSAKSYSNGSFSTSYGNYSQACRDLAAKYSVPYIDVNGIMADHYNSVGYDTAVSYHMAGAVSGSTDYTHFNEGGAKVIAGLIANAVKSQKIGRLSGYVK